MYYLLIYKIHFFLLFFLHSWQINYIYAEKIVDLELIFNFPCNIHSKYEIFFYLIAFIIFSLYIISFSICLDSYMIQKEETFLLYLDSILYFLMVSINSGYLVVRFYKLFFTIFPSGTENSSELKTIFLLKTSIS